MTGAGLRYAHRYSEALHEAADFVLEVVRQQLVEPTDQAKEEAHA